MIDARQPPQFLVGRVIGNRSLPHFPVQFSQILIEEELGNSAKGGGATPPFHFWVLSGSNLTHFLPS